MPTFEERYNDPLRSMEIALVQTYRADENMSDWETLNALNALIRQYTAVQRRRQPPHLTLSPLAQQSYDELKFVCQGWLGHNPVLDEAGQMADLGDKALSLQEVIDCLKRLRRSVEYWQKEGGRRGYFEFINDFLPLN
ncbi:MAG TPA: hypothetical protein PLD25_15310 [Chloroflexota bacterium]|nr:hypothetical protein [Chloroflexota bacterium]HUM71317.1 hypothetical protein [Chloroflexota bacterium]